MCRFFGVHADEVTEFRERVNGKKKKFFFKLSSNEYGMVSKM